MISIIQVITELDNPDIRIKTTDSYPKEKTRL